MNKKFTLIALALAGLSLTFTGCKDSKDAGQPSSSESTEVEEGEDTTIQPATEEDAKAYEDQKKMIEDFYANYVFGDKPYKEDILHKYCTDKLIKKLKDDYDMDDGGYAIWDFRTNAQDGDGESVVNDVTEISQNCLEVHFTDMGNKSSHRITFVNIGGEWRMDEVK